MRLKLEEIEVGGFKAFSEIKKLRLNSPVVVIVGPIGTGKTTILEAIEYALYGTLYSVKYRKELKSEDLINDFTDRIKIKLALVDSSGRRYVVYRSRSRDSAEALLEVDGKIVEKSWSKVDAKMRNILGIDLDGFVRQVALRSREIEDIIYGTDMQRSEALDRLLGIETLESIFRGIPLKLVEDKLEMLESELDFLKARLANERSVEEIERELEEKRKKLLVLEEEIDRKKKALIEYEHELEKLKGKEKEYERLKEQEIRLRAEIKQIKQRLKKLESFTPTEPADILFEKAKSSIINGLKETMLYKDAEEVEKIGFSRDTIDSALQVLNAKIKRLEASLEDLNSELLEVNYQLASERNKYNLLRRKLAEVEAELYTLEKNYNTLRGLVEKYGSRENVRKRISLLEVEIEKLEKISEINNCVYNLGRSVISTYLKESSATCPVCDTELNEQQIKKIEDKVNLIKKEDVFLKREKLVKNLNELKRVYVKLSELEERMLRKNELELEKKSLENEFDEVSNNIEELEELVEEVNFKISRLTSIISSSSSIITKLSRIKEISELQRELEDKKRELSEVLKKIARLDFDKKYYNSIEEKYYLTMNEIDRLKAEMANLEKDLENIKEKLVYVKKLTEKTEKQEAKIFKLKEFRNKLLEIKIAFREVQSSIRKIAIRKIVEKMNDIFQQMYVHPDYSELTIRIRTIKLRREDREYERSIYEIFAKRNRDRRWIPALKKMSDGQKRIVVLSLLTALFKLTPHNVAFIILDEPTPSIDYECRKAMIKLLAKVEGVDQIIIATQDESFKEIVREVPSALIYELKHTPEGTSINLYSFN